MTDAGRSSWLSAIERRIAGGLVAFVVFLLAVARFSRLTGIDTHEVPSAGALLVGAAWVGAAAALAALAAARIGGAGGRGSIRLLGLALVGSSAVSLMRTGFDPAAWLGLLVLAAGAALLLLARRAAQAPPGAPPEPA